MLRPRDVSLIVPAHKEGEPWRIRVSHRPSGINSEGTGATYDEARTAAEDGLTREVEVWEAAEALRNAPPQANLSGHGINDVAFAPAGPYGRHG